jgi:hypothetical protein
MAETGSAAHALCPRLSQENSMTMIHAPGRLHIGGVAYVVWADTPSGGCTVQRPVAVHMVIDHGVEGAGKGSCWVIQLRSGPLPLKRHDTASTKIGNGGRPRIRQV